VILIKTTYTEVNSVIKVSYDVTNVNVFDTNNTSIYVRTAYDENPISSGLIKVAYSDINTNIRVTYDVTNVTMSGIDSSPVYVTLDYSASGAATNLTSVGLTMPTGFSVANSPLTNSGTIGVSFAAGYSLPTDAEQATWDQAYNDKINSASVTGTTTKTLTLTQQDGGTITTSWSDYDTGLTSVGLTMPTAFTVNNSPLTSNGTIGVVANGTGAQYIKGDGTLGTFPTTIDQSLTLIREVYNRTGATLTKGTVVYIDGGQGNLPTVTKALAVGDTTSAQTFGIVQSNITNMNNGYVVVAGGINNLDTQAYPDGTALYLSPTTAGTWTSTKPYAPQHLVYLGVVVRSHPTQGVVEVKIQNGYELDELHNVSAQSPSNNDGIFYNTTTSLWEKKSIATALGYTPVTNARQLTINDVAYDLSADRAWSIGDYGTW